MTATHPIIDEDVARAVPGVASTRLGETVVVVHPQDDTVHILNSTAALIWDSIATTSTVAELIRHLAQQAGVEPALIADDVRTTLASFVRADIATVGSPSFALGPPDFTAEHNPNCNQHPTRFQDAPGFEPGQPRPIPPPHPLLTGLLDRTKWTCVIGPVRAGVAVVTIRTNNNEIATTLKSTTEALPEVPPDEIADTPATTGPREADNAAGDDRSNGSPPHRAFSDHEFRPGVFRATDPRAITREPSRPRTPEPRVPYDPRAEEESEPENKTTPTDISILDTGKEGSRRFRVFVDGRLSWVGDSAAATLRFFTTELNQICVQQSSDHITFHGGALERNGKVVLIAGDSGHGKSTLTAALAMRGFNYVTDEVVVVDHDSLNVIPFPKAIDLDTSARTLIGLGPSSGDAPLEFGEFTHRSMSKLSVTPRQLGNISSGGTLALVVLLDDPNGQPKASTTEPLPADIALLVDLLGTVFRPCFTNPHNLRALTTLSQRVSVSRLARVSLEAACESVISTFEGLAEQDTTI